MIHRPRRLRSNPLLRDMVRETAISRHQFIMPLFLCDGIQIHREIPSMPQQYHYSEDCIQGVVEGLLKQGVSRFLLFGIPEQKDGCGSQSYDPEGIVNRCIRRLKESFGSDVFLIPDICLCEYTDHGHCGILQDNDVLNDATLPLLGQIALSNAQAGADMVAPSDMMDGRIAAIRQVLDKNGYQNLPIMSYSAKYASAFYGPFREAAHSAPQQGNRRSYQMDVGNGREALREVQLDIAEGADIVMVKPALSYLDIIHQVKEISSVPVAAYSVSGEYAMIKAMAQAGLMDEEALMLETAQSIFRAGADILISYYTPELVNACAMGKL